MSAQPYLTVSQIRDSLRQWLAKVVPPNVPVFLEDESETDDARPKPPYIALKFPFAGPVNVGGRDDRRVDGSTFTLGMQRQATASIEVIGKKAADLMALIMDSLSKPDVVTFFDGAGLGRGAVTGPRDLSVLENSAWRRRMQVEIDFYYANEVPVNLQPIEEVVVTGPRGTKVDVQSS